MDLRSPARLRLVLIAALFPELAAALDGTYEGMLEPEARGFGTFNLPRKAPESFKAEPTRAPVTTSSCLKANTQCLLGCPRTDEGAEFVCSNRCRTKLNSCKERVKKATTTAPRPSEVASAA